MALVDLSREAMLLSNAKQVRSAAGEVARDYSATRIARVVAIEILLTQMRGPNTHVYVYDRLTGVGQRPYEFSGDPLRCQLIMIGEPLLDTPPVPDEVYYAVERLLTEIARDPKNELVIRNVAHCALGKPALQ